MMVSNEDLQKRYVVPLMSMPDKPLGFTQWLAHHKLSIEKKIDSLANKGGRYVYD